MTSFYQIAIDGYSSCGKSTLAKDLAETLHFTHIDSGAMYRAVTLYVLDNALKIEPSDEIDEIIDGLDIDFEVIDGKRFVRLNGQIVEPTIREQRISDMVSQVSVIRSVREHLVKLQRQMSTSANVIMEGRDIGTVVFPDADIKLFVTARQDVRVERRWQELTAKGIDISKQEVEENLILRDHIDSTREIAPLRRASDALLIDNSKMGRREQVDFALKIIKARIPELRG